MSGTEDLVANAKALPAVCSYLDTIGSTPMVKLDRSVPDAAKAQGTTVLVKLECQNPGGSLKDRIALNMIEKAEARGEISPGKSTIIDATSGNTGIGYAMVCAAKGYKCIIIMPRVPPMLERYMICRQFGAEVHLTNPAKGFPGMIEHMKGLLEANPDYWCPNQFGSADNPGAHFENTGPEIWAQTEGKVDYFVHGIGTGGAISGCGTFLKSKNPAIKVVALEPSESRVHVGAQPKPHGIVGWAPGIHSPYFEGHDWKDQGKELTDLPRDVIDEWGHCSTEDATAMILHLTRTEGMMLGPSSGAAIKYAFEVASRPEAAGKTLVVLAPSHGIRYTAHPVWKSSKAEGQAACMVEVCQDKEQPTLAWRSQQFQADN